MTSDSTSPWRTPEGCPKRRSPRDWRGEQAAPPALLLAGASGVEEAARGLASRLNEKIRPAVKRPGFADLVEEYSLWHVGSFAPELSADQALARVPPGIARLLPL